MNIWTPSDGEASNRVCEMKRQLSESKFQLEVQLRKGPSRVKGHMYCRRAQKDESNITAKYVISNPEYLDRLEVKIHPKGIVM